MQKKALITGITGQDGSYLAEFLIEKGYVVHGIKRRTSTFNTERIDHIHKESWETEQENLILHHGDMTDSSSLLRIVEKVQPDEIYNLAAQSHVAVSFEEPEYTANSDALGTLRLLEAIRILNLKDTTRFYQASTSELYGNSTISPQNELTPFYPRSPYGAAKLYAYWIVVNYRESYDMFARNGILFNHESPRRGGTFVTKKITNAVAKIYLKKQKVLHLGNLNSLRDWGHAKDYVEGMWKILQHNTAEDFVLATNTNYSIREFTILVFEKLGIEIEFKGKGLDEVGVVKNISSDAKVNLGQEVVKIDPRYFRPSEVDFLLGDYSKAKKELGWEPKTSISDLVNMMVESDLLLAEQEKVLIDKNLFKPTWDNPKI